MVEPPSISVKISYQTNSLARLGLGLCRPHARVRELESTDELALLAARVVDLVLLAVLDRLGWVDRGPHQSLHLAGSAH